MNLSKFLGFAWLVLCVSAYANSTQTTKTKQESEQSIISPSFDCKKARTNTEKLICSDKELAALDKEMAQAYKKARVSLDKAGKQKLLKKQREWLRYLRKAGERNLDERSVKSSLELMLSTQIYKLSHYALQERTKEMYLSSLRYDSKNLALDVGEFEIGGKKFVIIVLRNWEDKDGTGWNRKDFSCANIFDDNGDSQGFCWGNSIGEVPSKDEYFTITSLKEPKGEGKNNLEYLTFKLIKDKFYLHQFSKQLLDDGLDEVGEPLIYYRALRDERDKKHKIKLEAVNDALLNDFINKYEQEY